MAVCPAGRDCTFEEAPIYGVACRIYNKKSDIRKKNRFFERFFFDWKHLEAKNILFRL